MNNRKSCEGGQAGIRMQDPRIEKQRYTPKHAHLSNQQTPQQPDRVNPGNDLQNHLTSLGGIQTSILVSS